MPPQVAQTTVPWYREQRPLPVTAPHRSRDRAGLPHLRFDYSGWGSVARYGMQNLPVFCGAVKTC
jgi:hypothetical protein